MGKIALISSLLAICFSACAEDAHHASARLVKTELARLSGTSAVDCGLVPLGQSAERAWACALAAQKSKKPFWLAFQERSIDSVMWLAVGRDAHGNPYVLTYDSSPYGRPGLHPRISRDICASNTKFDPQAENFGCRGFAP